MKYLSSNTKQIYEISFDNGKAYVCPECSSDRKKSKLKDLRYYHDTNRAYCFHCNTTFFEYKPFEKTEYVIPERKNDTNLTDKAVKYFKGRKIDQETLNKFHIYSETEWMPQLEKEVEVLCFPYFINSELINIKFRGANKSFKLNSGSRLTWYNYDAILQNDEIIIVEGEIDLLSFAQCGKDNCISVPNGAKNTEFIDESIELFNDKRIIIAVDNDTSGIELRDDLIRRFGAENCSTVNFKECKDANEYLIKYGSFELEKAAKEATEIPIEGNISVKSFRSDIEDLYKNGLQKGAIVGVDEIDEFCTWETKRLAIVTGRPGSGKSEFIDYILARLNILHGWKSVFFTPENYPLKFHYAKMFEKLIGREFSAAKTEQIDYDIAYEHIKENFFYILPENDLTLDKILINARAYIKSKGVKVIVLDPYNKIDHQIASNLTETQYVSKVLDKLTMFAKLNDVLIILAAHPVKLDKDSVPTLYNISGSAHFYNKADYGFTTHRIFDEANVMTNDIEIHWQKIKFKNLGKQGVSELVYNYVNGRFEKRGTTNWDNTNWLVGGLPKDIKVEQLEINDSEPF